MSSDRELLELAAKAAGYEVNIALGGGSWINDGSRIWPKWNPLTDDGDALRLAVSLGIELMLRLDSDSVMTYFEVAGQGSNAAERPSEHDGNVHSAVRRAFVRSAAQIGKAMP